MRGGAFGFATEVGPGPAIPPVETLRSMLTDQHLWPPDECWTLHSGGGVFKDRDLFDQALAGRYGAPKDLDDYVWKAQLASYEAERAMFEAYARRKYRATGVIQWMLNNAWPSLIWHLWDHALRPGGGYYGTKKACEALHIQYDDGENTVSIVSDLPEASVGLTARVRLLDTELAERFRYEVELAIAADGVASQRLRPARSRRAGAHTLPAARARGQPRGLAQPQLLLALEPARCARLRRSQLVRDAPQGARQLSRARSAAARFPAVRKPGEPAGGGSLPGRPGQRSLPPAKPGRRAGILHAAPAPERPRRRSPPRALQRQLRQLAARGNPGPFGDRAPAVCGFSAVYRSYGATPDAFCTRTLVTLANNFIQSAVLHGALKASFTPR